MKPMLSVSAAVLLAAISVLPAFAATTPPKLVVTKVAAMTPAMDSAEMAIGVKKNAVGINSLLYRIGNFDKASLTALDTAKSVAVFDAKTIYSANDLKLLDKAVGADKAKLDKFHAALMADAGLKAWFTKNKLDITKTLATVDAKGTVSLYIDA